MTEPATVEPPEGPGDGRIVDGVPVRRLRAALRRLREQGEEHLEESGELNLVPYLDIVMNIIMFLLATVTFQATLASLNTTLPTAALAQDAPTPPKAELNLTVSISERWYTLATACAVLFRGFSLTAEGVVQTSTELPTLPSVNGQLDTDGLTRALLQIKERYPEEERAILSASPLVSYEQVIKTMDAMRESGPKTLFPGVLLSAGVQ